MVYPHAIMMQTRARAMLCLESENYPTALQAVTEGETTLLDRTMILYGCGTSTTHNANNYPIILAGGTHCGFQHGALHRYTDATPFANTHLTIAKKMGLKINQFADSTGSMTDLVG